MNDDTPTTLAFNGSELTHREKCLYRCAATVMANAILGQLAQALRPEVAKQATDGALGLCLLPVADAVLDEGIERNMNLFIDDCGDYIKAAIKEATAKAKEKRIITPDEGRSRLIVPGRG